MTGSCSSRAGARRRPRITLAVTIGATLAGCGPEGPPPAPDDSRLVPIAAYERAIRTGDGHAYWAAFTAQARERSAATDDFTFPARPDFRVEVDSVLERETTAAAFARRNGGAEVQHEGYLLRREADAWRIERIVGQNDPIDPTTFLPPESGRFLAAGTPWDSVPAVGAGAPPSWQAVRDESYLYLRVAYPLEVPPAGAALDDAEALPGMPPARASITVSLGHEAAGSPGTGPGPSSAFRFHLVLSESVATRFQDGRNRHTLSYSLTLSDDDGLHYSESLPAEGALVAHEGRAFLVRLPLATLGADPGGSLLVSPLADGVEPFAPTPY